LPKKTALTTTTAGADFYIALKDNQPTLYRLAQKKLDHLPAAWTSEIESGHGRIEHRELRVAGFDLDTSLFPGARQVLSITRHYQPKNGGEPKQETRHFILSIEEGECSHARLAQIGREHWSVENKNHWRRDATRWREDRSVRRKPKGAKNLALLRGAILALIPPKKFTSLNAAFDHYSENRTEALRLLNQTPAHCP
jgi:hypothetical protein